MTSTSRRYYEKELGAGIGPSPGFDEHFGYTEPFRRFVQHEGFEPQANEIPNLMPSWMPGEDYYTDFRKGDPYVKVDQGFARLPGAGYEALHPELKVGLFVLPQQKQLRAGAQGTGLVFVRAPMRAEICLGALWTRRSFSSELSSRWSASEEPA